MEQICTMKGHKKCVNSVGFSPNVKRVISCSNDYTIKLWDSRSGECLKTIHGHAGYIYSASYSPDGKCLLSAGGDNCIKFWDPITG